MLKKLSVPVLLLFLISVTAVLWSFGRTPESLVRQDLPAEDSEQAVSTAVEENEIAKAAATPTPTPEPIEITFLGDMMFDRNIRLKAQEAGYDFILEAVEHLWQESDLVVGNLEAPITTAESVSVGSEVGSPANFTFTTDPTIVEVLSQYPFVANLGNNHIFNFYDEGIVATEAFLASAEIPYFGQTGHEDSPTYTVVTLEDTTIAFINYNQFVDGGDVEQTLADLEALETETDLQIVYTHWGIEYEPTARPVIENLAHQFVDAGADLIIGSHPHVIQNNEIYNDVPIYYSLGNFVFDQYFNEEVRIGLVVTAFIDPTTLEIETAETKVRLENSGQTVPFTQN